MGEVVFVDQGELDKIPSAVRDALSKESGAIPHVALSDGAGTKVYGTSSHATLLKEGLSGALRQAKRAMRDDQRTAGTPAPEVKSASDPEPAPSSTASGSAPPDGIRVVEKSGAKEVTGAPLEKWTSSKGTQITARLTRVSGNLFTLVNDKGKTITVTERDLNAVSAERVHEILRGN
jgi:hypothetical protein